MEQLEIDFYPPPSGDELKNHPETKVYIDGQCVVYIHSSGIMIVEPIHNG